MSSPWGWAEQLSAPFLPIEIFYVFEASYCVSPKHFCAQHQTIGFLLFMAMLFSSWMTHTWLILPLEVPFSALHFFFLWLCVLLGSLGLFPLVWASLKRVASKWAQCCSWRAAGLFHISLRDTLVCIPHAAMGFIGTVLLVHVCIFVYGFPTSCAFPVWNFI